MQNKKYNLTVINEKLLIFAETSEMKTNVVEINGRKCEGNAHDERHYCYSTQSAVRSIIILEFPTTQQTTILNDERHNHILLLN